MKLVLAIVTDTRYDGFTVEQWVQANHAFGLHIHGPCLAANGWSFANNHPRPSSVTYLGHGASQVRGGLRVVFSFVIAIANHDWVIANLDWVGSRSGLH